MAIGGHLLEALDRQSRTLVSTSTPSQEGAGEACIDRDPIPLVGEVPVLISELLTACGNGPSSFLLGLGKDSLGAPRIATGTQFGNLKVLPLLKHLAGHPPGRRSAPHLDVHPD